MAAPESIQVEVSYALADRQQLLALRLPQGSSALDALIASGLIEAEGLLPPFDLGIYGRRCTAQTLLSDGDRVEIYRPLRFDPMESRRRRAAKAQRR